MTRPHARHRGGERDPGRFDHENTAPVRPDHPIGPPDEHELLIEVHRLSDPVLRRIRQQHGSDPDRGQHRVVGG